MRHEPSAYFFHILDAIKLTQQFLAGKSIENYLADEMLQSAVERQLTIIGEALSQLRRIDDSLLDGITDAVRIIGFRNVLVHGYAVVRVEVAWDAATTRLPMLQREVTNILRQRGELA